MQPIFINNLEFAKKSQEITGQVDLSDFERLAEALSYSKKSPISIHYHLIGSAKKMHLPSLHLQIVAKLPTLCQRCLEEMQLDFVLDYHYVISAAEPTEFTDNDEIEWLEPIKEMNLSELIEDELLMALPIAPTHQSNCAPTSLQAGDKPNSFAALKERLK